MLRIKRVAYLGLGFLLLRQLFFKFLDALAQLFQLFLGRGETEDRRADQPCGDEGFNPAYFFALPWFATARCAFAIASASPK